MDILVPDEWMRNFLETKATPKKIGEYLSLAGPSVDKVEKKKDTHIYHIEVTTNRVDAASVYGIAREVRAILPRFGVKAELARADYDPDINFTKKVNYLDAEVDHKLCPRFTAVLIKDVEIKESPEWVKERLRWVNVRPINNIVDISNYILHELGQPVHTFDYDKIKHAKMVLRESKKGEEITTLDGKSHKLPGGDIVIENGEGRLIDLAGIMGAENSAVDKDTKNVLLFVQTYNPVNIRQTSMSLPKRTEAAVLFEKGLDKEGVTVAIGRGIELFEKLTGGKAEKKILDLYPNPYDPKTVKTSLDFINKRMGVDLDKKEITSYLEPLGFETKWEKNTLKVTVPSYRKDDIEIEEDILEEVARIYGYHNLETKLMEGKLPDPITDSPFDFESKVKNALKGWGGVEVYTYSMVPEEYTNGKGLKLKNPLGKESEYMRTSLKPSLVDAAKENSGEKDPFHLFEVANVYLPRKGKLPEEKMTLAGIFSNYSYRDAKGTIEALMKELNIRADITTKDKKGYLPSQSVVIKGKNKKLGEFGRLQEGYIYYEFDMEKLRDVHSPISPYIPIPKYPAQIEDLTLVLPSKTKVGEVIEGIEDSDKLIRKVELVDTYEDAYTFRLWYRHAKKTLTDKEVEEIREKAVKKVKKKFGTRLKS